MEQDPSWNENWEEDDVITDYISNPVLNLIAELGSGNVTEELCQNLHLKIESAKQNIEMKWRITVSRGARSEKN